MFGAAAPCLYRVPDVLESPLIVASGVSLMFSARFHGVSLGIVRAYFNGPPTVGTFDVFLLDELPRLLATAQASACASTRDDFLHFGDVLR